MTVSLCYRYKAKDACAFCHEEINDEEGEASLGYQPGERTRPYVCVDFPRPNKYFHVDCFVTSGQELSEAVIRSIPVKWQDKALTRLVYSEKLSREVRRK